MAKIRCTHPDWEPTINGWAWERLADGTMLSPDIPEDEARAIAELAFYELFDPKKKPKKPEEPATPA